LKKTHGTGLLIGYGSIGRRHAEVLDGICEELVIVDAKPAAREQASAAFPSARIVKGLSAGDGALGEPQKTLAVIATWGPSHAALFHDLADLGIRRILCEKPLANSVGAARKMVERSDREEVLLGVHHFIRFTRLAPALLEFSREHALGEPVAVVVEGGAGCLVTNGLHWIDFASTLFGATPRRVVGTARGEPPSR
jgi:predicted dehydrogenase